MPAPGGSPETLLSKAGWVLAGGQSSRMGRDKALLPFHNETLVQAVVREVEAAAGSAMLVGPAASLGAVGIPVLEDDHPGLGPAGGIATILHHTSAEWNLIVACDMPRIDGEFLRHLVMAAIASGADCLIPLDATGRRHPLCGVYHVRARHAFREALDRDERAVRQILHSLRVHEERVDGMELRNVNTPGEWEEVLANAAG